MFIKIEKEKRKKLISLYEKYIENQNIENIQDFIEDCTFDTGCVVFSKEMNYAGSKAYDMSGEKLSKKGAKEILSKLKSPLRRGLKKNILF